MSIIKRKEIRQRVHKRIRRKVAGSPERPRLAVFFSNQHVYAQIIDDSKGRTLCAASTLDKSVERHAANSACAATVGKLVAERALAANISAVVFDRGGHLFHGKVKALADAAREGGLNF
ncbi:MAG: 50S ribosomal protein L18 [Akkermansiaceae bacterium]|jgi:large subunit ribosomal protein L18|nr:50S ribosomal protein L18 [Akkermansiaceae bacterium]